MVLAERLVHKVSDNAVLFEKSFLIGLFQALALFPGVSRSAATTSGGMILGLDRKNAAKFSFLLAVPIVWGTGLYEFYSLYTGSSYLTYNVSPVNILVGFLTSFITGLLCIKFLLTFLENHTLYPFIFYRLALAGVIIASLCLV